MQNHENIQYIIEMAIADASAIGAIAPNDCVSNKIAALVKDRFLWKSPYVWQTLSSFVEGAPGNVCVCWWFSSDATQCLHLYNAFGGDNTLASLVLTDLNNMNSVEVEYDRAAVVATVDYEQEVLALATAGHERCVLGY